MTATDSDSPSSSTRDFSRLWLAKGVSAVGSRITREGLPFAAVLSLSATPVQMGYLVGAGGVPVLAFGLLAGVWVDRVRRLRVLVVSDLVRALALAFVPLAAVFGILAMWHLYVVCAVTATFTLFFNVADRSYLTTLVPRDRLVEANSKLSATDAAAEVCGPALAGALVQILTAPIAIAVDALTFLWSAACLGSIRQVETPPAASALSASSVGRELLEGLRVTWRDRSLRALAVHTALRDFFGWFFAALYAFFSIKVLGFSAGTVGILVATGGVGSFVGAATAPRLTRVFGPGPLLVASAVIRGVLSSVVIVVARPGWVGFIALLVGQLVGDAAGESHAITATSLRQTLVPDRYLGRANATFEFLAGTAGPMGALVAGALAQGIGARSTLIVASFGILLAALPLVISPLRRLRTLDPSTP